MAFNRYKNDSRQGGGAAIETAKSVLILRRAMKQGTIYQVKKIITTGYDRLDTLSGIIYGDARYWWVLAAASNIGWGLQVPPGTTINVLDLVAVQRLVG
jgi:hypothetical protein